MTRETELQAEEEMKIKDEYDKMKSKVQAEINLVKRKLKEESLERRRQAEQEISDKNRVRKLTMLYYYLLSIHHSQNVCSLFHFNRHWKESTSKSFKDLKANCRK